MDPPEASSMYTVYTLYNNTGVKYKPTAAVYWKEETEIKYYILNTKNAIVYSSPTLLFFKKLKQNKEKKHCTSVQYCVHHGGGNRMEQGGKLC